MTISDQDIVNAIKRDRERGFRLLMTRFREPIYWHVRRLVVSYDDAQDATQETFVRVFRSFSQFSNKGSFTAWVYRIATNEALRVIAQRKQTLTSLDGEAQLMIAGSYVDYSDLEAVKLQKAILALPTKQQMVFNLRYYDDMPYEQIAEVADTTVGAAKTNYHIAKEKIVNYMNSHD